MQEFEGTNCDRLEGKIKACRKSGGKITDWINNQHQVATRYCQADKCSFVKNQRESKSRKEIGFIWNKDKDLQISLEKGLFDLNHSKKVGDKEKTNRKSLNNKLIEVTNDKDAQIAKLAKKLDATKAFLATVSHDKQQKKQNEVKTHKSPQLVSGNDKVVQSEEKANEQSKKKKGNRSSVESLETNKSIDTVNSMKLLKENR